MVELLLKAGAKIALTGGKYGTALQAAAYSRELDIFQLLLDWKADGNAKVGGEYGTALQAASFRGGLEMVELLLQAGAKV
ncbi:hypothetical protein B0H14DRAFT_2466452, partial [Mycena olivaceomarginata]